VLEDRQVPAVFNPLAATADGASGSLRDAVIQANGNREDDVINLQTGLYRLSVANTAGQENAAAQGDLDPRDAGHTVTIQGAGPDATVIDAGSIDRVFQVFPGVTVVFRNLTLSGGSARDDDTPGVAPFTTDAQGGGIWSKGATVTLENVVLDQ